MTRGFSSAPAQAQFQNLVWEMVRQIPEGKVATYGQIAGYLPIPQGMDPRTYHAFSPRWVGGAMANCPDNVPWHRVINAQGKISLIGSSAQQEQRKLLENEGILFSDTGKIDLDKYRWSGPGEFTEP